MRDLDKQLKELNREFIDLKVALVQQEANYARALDILDRLTTSVEHHIKRTDDLQEVIELQKEQNLLTAKSNELAVEKLKSQQELDKVILENSIQNKIESDKKLWKTLTIIGAIILALKELGILDKLF